MNLAGLPGGVRARPAIPRIGRLPSGQLQPAAQHNHQPGHLAGDLGRGGPLPPGLVNGDARNIGNGGREPHRVPALSSGRSSEQERGEQARLPAGTAVGHHLDQFKDVSDHRQHARHGQPGPQRVEVLCSHHIASPDRQVSESAHRTRRAQAPAPAPVDNGAAPFTELQSAVDKAARAGTAQQTLAAKYA